MCDPPRSYLPPAPRYLLDFHKTCLPSHLFKFDKAVSKMSQSLIRTSDSGGDEATKGGEEDEEGIQLETFSEGSVLSHFAHNSHFANNLHFANNSHFAYNSHFANN